VRKCACEIRYDVGAPAPEDYQRISDPRVLRAIAHPTRERVLAELYAAGPMRAADVAAAIGIPANQASFHLRQLAKYGLIAEAPELARDGRDRVWRPVNEHGLALEVGELEQTPGGRAAVEVWQRQTTAVIHDLVERAFAARRTEGKHVNTSTYALRLTEAEARQLSGEIMDLVDGWHQRTAKADGGPAVDPDGRETYHLLQILQPYPEVEE
jgi:DNA-binding transcriptional ArsR family regulator